MLGFKIVNEAFVKVTDEYLQKNTTTQELNQVYKLFKIATVLGWLTVVVLTMLTSFTVGLFVAVLAIWLIALVETGISTAREYMESRNA